MKKTFLRLASTLFIFSAFCASIEAGEAHALAIGLNSVDPLHYGGWSGPLNACELDALDMQNIAKAQGFTTEALLTKAATRSAVLGALTKEASDLESGDLLVVSYSGHGGTEPDENGDEADAQDETWCLYDGQLLDDELAALWPKFKEGVKICVYSDSCHSGTVTKYAQYLASLRAPSLPAASLAGLQERFAFLSSEKTADPQPVETKLFRAMPDQVAVATYVQNRAFYDAIQAATPKEKDSASKVVATVILISGCQDNQLSADGAFNGLFTAKLKQVWNNGGFKGSHLDFRNMILDLMPAYQSPNYYVVGKSNPPFEAERPWTK